MCLYFFSSWWITLIMRYRRLYFLKSKFPLGKFNMQYLYQQNDPREFFLQIISEFWTLEMKSHGDACELLERHNSYSLLISV